MNGGAEAAILCQNNYSNVCNPKSIVSVQWQNLKLKFNVFNPSQTVDVNLISILFMMLEA